MSYLEQESLELNSLLSSNAEERRFLFEEASGISKYKKRKRETERKLLATENDILRIKDVIAEVERQVNSLKRQAQKAKRFKEIKEKLENLELNLYKGKHKDLTLILSQIDQRFEKKDTEKEKVERDVREKEKRLTSLKGELLQREKELSSLQEKQLFLSQNSHQLETEILIKKDQKRNLEELINRSTEEIENLNSKISSVKDEKKEKERRLVVCLEESKNKKKQIAQKEQELKSREEIIKEAKAKFEDLNLKLKEKEKNLHKSEYELKIQKNDLDQKTAQSQSTAEKKKELELQLQDIEKGLSQLFSEGREKQNLLRKEIDVNVVLQEDYDFISKENERFSGERTRLESEQKLQNAEYRILDELLLTSGGYGFGTKMILESKKNLSGIIDSLAKLVKTEKTYSHAIELALGEALSYIVCEDEQSAKKAISFLKEKKAGKATFLILKRLNHKEINLERPDLPAQFGENSPFEIIGWANELIECDQSYKALFDLFLGRVLVVSGSDNTFEGLSFLGDFSNYDIVSLEGEVFRRGYILEGGQKKEKNLLGGEERIGSIRQNLERIEDDLKKINTKINELSQRKGQIENKLKDKAKRIEELRLSKEKNDERIKELTLKKDILFSQLKVIEDQGDKQASKISVLNQNLKDKKEENLGFSEEKEVLLAQTEESKKNLDALQKIYEEDYERLNSLRFDMVSLQGKEEKLTSEKERLSELLDELKIALSEKEKEKNRFSDRVQDLESSIKEKEKKRKEFSQEKELQEKIVESKENLKKGLLEKVNEIESDLESLREKKETISEEIHRIQLEKLSISSEIQRLKEKVWEEYQMELEKIAIEKDEENQKKEVYKDEVQVLKERLKRIGTVNLLALEEYQSQKKRFDFLTSQLDDLLSAEKSLKEAIVIINKTARKLFLETFDKIKVNFQRVFSELFEGGEADLKLRDGDDPLEAFIEITANPKGKTLLSLNQLSGGEKALTAISLLFAIYLVKPSPFCILDEVDAPLDDANLLRFIRLLKSFSTDTQFVIITHNKLTMEAADVLYGVTMERSGVSRIVSVKLKEDEITA